MAGRWNSTSIVSSFPLLLLKAWNEWDVRGMVLFSLILQIALFVLGMRRKRTINLFYKTILWFAYLGADWIAIASLGKLPSSHAESPTTNILRAFWAPLLILHLGGPDTITAYSFEDNKLWIRHLFTLIVKATLVLYVICLSWTSSWISFLTLPLILAGIIKYGERIVCLKLNNSQQTEPVFHIFNSRDESILHILDEFSSKYSSILQGYLLFTVMRSDVNDYLFSNLDFTKMRIETYLEETFGTNKSLVKSVLKDVLFEFEHFRSDIITRVGVELGFIFDVVYTKATLIYTKSGCLLRFTSIACSFSVMLIFFINIMNEPKFYLPRIDTIITCILLGGATTLELYAAWVMLSSDWAILVATFHHNALVRKGFWVVLNYFPCFFHQSKRWSGYMGQFDLLEYCWRYKKKEANKSCSILQKITTCSDIIEMWHKHKFLNSVEVPTYLMQSSTYSVLQDSFLQENSFKASRGEKALSLARQTDSLKWSIEFDFDYSIIIWHLATSVLLFQMDLIHREEKKVSKCMSNYMMYLLTMRTTLLLPEHTKSFWLDQTCDELKKLFVSAPDTKNAAYILLHKENASTSKPTLKKVQEDVHNLVTCLDQVPMSIKWKMIMEVWTEMLLYAALSSEHINHVKLLGEGIEFLSFLWLFGIHGIAYHCIGKEEEE